MVSEIIYQVLLIALLWLLPWECAQLIGVHAHTAVEYFAHRYRSTLSFGRMQMKFYGCPIANAVRVYKKYDM